MMADVAAAVPGLAAAVEVVATGAARGGVNCSALNVSNMGYYRHICRQKAFTSIVGHNFR